MNDGNHAVLIIENMLKSLTVSTSHIMMQQIFQI